MKTINVTFEDWEYKKLIQKKGKRSWHDFIMTLVEGAMTEVTRVLIDKVGRKLIFATDFQK